MIQFDSPLRSAQLLFTSPASLFKPQPHGEPTDSFHSGSHETAPPTRAQMLAACRRESEPAKLDGYYNANDFVGNVDKAVEHSFLKGVKGMHIPFGVSGALVPGLGLTKVFSNDKDHPNSNRAEGVVDVLEGVKSAAENKTVAQALKAAGEGGNKLISGAVKVASSPLGEGALKFGGRLLGPAGHAVATVQRINDIKDSSATLQKLKNNNLADKGRLHDEIVGQDVRMAGMAFSAALETTAGVVTCVPGGQLVGAAIGIAAFGVEMGTRAVTNDEAELQKKLLI